MKNYFRIESILTVILMSLFILTGVVEVEAKKTNGIIKIPYLNSVNIESTWQRLGDFAKVVIPRNITFKNERIENVLTVGDKITIHLGYDGFNAPEFIGYIVRIEPNVPLIIHCEDDIYLLKQKAVVNKSFASATLKDIITHIAPDIADQAEITDTNIGKFMIKDVNAAKVLQDIREQYGLASFFRAEKLYSGASYFGTPTKHNFSFAKNVAKNNLQFRRKEDYKVEFVARCITSENKKVEAKAGDEGGEKRVQQFPGNLTQADLQKIADDNIKLIKIDGFSGDLVSFGLPRTQHGDIALITDDEFEDRNGSYYIDTVKIQYGLNGYRRVNTLGRRFIDK